MAPILQYAQGTCGFLITEFCQAPHVRGTLNPRLCCEGTGEVLGKKSIFFGKILCGFVEKRAFGFKIFFGCLALLPPLPVAEGRRRAAYFPPGSHPHSPPLWDLFCFGRFPQQRIMVCWKSLETIKYHLGSFIAALAALGEKHFA